MSRLAGIPRQARQVGYALSALKDQQIPWHRVINAKGEISKRSDPVFETIQRQLLEEEGITLINGHISLQQFQWRANNP